MLMEIYLRELQVRLGLGLGFGLVLVLGLGFGLVLGLGSRYSKQPLGPSIPPTPHPQAMQQAARMFQNALRCRKARGLITEWRRRVEHLAASRIQGLLRGFGARMHVAWMRRWEEARGRAAKRIQACLRRRLAAVEVKRRRQRAERAAAERLQGLVRGHLARVRVRTLRDAIEHGSARRKQGGVWGWVARAFVRRKRAEAEWRASQVLTALVRGHLARCSVSSWRRDTEAVAACRIQALLRGHAARRNVAWLLQQWLDEERCKAMDRAAGVIQGFLRGALARRQVKQTRRDAEDTAASRIQGSSSLTLIGCKALTADLCFDPRLWSRVACFLAL